MSSHVVLVVEDSIIVNKHISLCLSSEGYTVFSAHNPQEAMDHLNGHAFDLILLDVMLNDKIDGIQLAREINEKLSVPIIYLTALSDKETIERAKITQPYGYIIKPFNESELLTNIEVALHKSKFEQEIKRNHDFLETVLQHVKESIIVLDDDFRTEYLNSTAENDIGISFKDLFKENIDRAFTLSWQPKPEHGNTFRFSEFFKDYGSESVEKPLFLNRKVDGVIVPIGNILIRQFNNVSQDKNAIIFIFNDITERLKKLEIEKELTIKKLSLLIEGQELERARFSKEIHDGLGQILNLAKMKIESGDINTNDADVTLMINEAISEVKRISNNLLPSLLNDFDLATCLNHLARQYNKLKKTTVNVLHQDVPPLSLNTKINAYRIVQEAINNAIKHGRAENITIQLIGIENEVQLTIEDDGKGFNIGKIDDVDTHHGLQIMTQRVQSFGGVIDIESDRKLGTMITISFPAK